MPAKLNIVIIQGAFLPVPAIQGGAVEKLWEAKAREFVRLGHSVFYICKKVPLQPWVETADGIKFHRVRGFDSPKRLILRLWLDLIYTLLACRAIPIGADVVVTNTFFAPIIIRFFSSAAVYVDVARMPKGQMKFYTHSARLRATSTAVYDQICRELPLKHHELVKTIPNPLPFVCESLDNVSKQNMVLYVGRVNAEKGLILLRETSFALERLNWRLVVVGPSEIKHGGSGEMYLRELVTSFSKATIFTGAIFDASKLQEFYEQSRIFVYPSIAEYGETFGLAPLEAMAFGAVPVVSGLKCFRDFIVDGVNGIIFDHSEQSAGCILRDKIVNLIIEDNKLNDMSLKAREVNRSHNLTSIAEEFIDDFNTVIREV